VADRTTPLPTPSDEIVFRCATCGKPKPNDAAWARSATCCGKSSWVSVLTFTETIEGPVVTGDVRYGLVVPDE
jgi:hypothetical protein